MDEITFILFCALCFVAGWQLMDSKWHSGYLELVDENYSLTKELRHNQERVDRMVEQIRECKLHHNKSSNLISK